MTLREIAMHCKIKQSEQEADKYKQQSDLYESVLTGDVTEFVVPNSWTKIRQGAFNACTSLASITISNSVTSIESGAFSSCVLLTSIDIPTSVLAIKGSAFYGCVALTDITIPNAVTIISAGVFTNCSKLTNVTLGDNFNCNGLDLSSSTKYSVDTLVAMFTALADRTGQTAYTLKLGAKNLAKLSDEQKAIATDKNWTLA
ncbi:MAG: leucine-rich repeat domain-containing protein [Candidatus Pseudoruminococcus sp.]|nr:leucine-rich repeat domain-containing protein [Candidatus Pseudoruminococcus sp.]